MKKAYVEPETEILKFMSSDIITTSGNPTTGDLEEGDMELP